jgi:hypothetical protein
MTQNPMSKLRAYLAYVAAGAGGVAAFFVWLSFFRGKRKRGSQ